MFYGTEKHFPTIVLMYWVMDIAETKMATILDFKMAVISFFFLSFLASGKVWNLILASKYMFFGHAKHFATIIYYIEVLSIGNVKNVDGC